MSVLEKKSVDQWLDSVDYTYLNQGGYIPSQFALEFVNMIKMINLNTNGESNKTPVFHLKMLDSILGKKENIVNLCFRGSGKTSIFIEYLLFYLVIFGEIPGFGSVEGVIYVSDSMENGCKSARKNIETRYNNSPWLKEFIPKVKFTDVYLEFENINGFKVGVRLFGAQTGLKGTKIFGKRPTLAILDDLIKDDGDARSKTIMQSIKDTVYKDVNYALDPTRKKTIFSGTPYNKQDVIYEAVESGGWNVNVYPVCEKFPCSREEFVGAWQDRFSYDYVLNQYNLSKSNGQVSAFNQELMLRISSEEERLIQDNEINWYARKTVLDNLSNFNIYITTDASFSDKNTADNGVISVWAVNNNGDYFWIDGICKKQIISGFIDDLFTLVQKYKPQTVGIEISGQQVALISYLQAEMITRNIFFNIARDKVNNQLGLRPVKSKFERFNMVIPLFSQGKFYFPKEMENTQIMKQFIGELKLVSYSGIKGSDDCLDTVSMLMYMNIIKPSVTSEINKKVDNVYHFYEPVEDNRSINSYLVD